MRPLQQAASARATADRLQVLLASSPLLHEHRRSTCSTAGLPRPHTGGTKAGLGCCRKTQVDSCICIRKQRMCVKSQACADAEQRLAMTLQAASSSVDPTFSAQETTVPKVPVQRQATDPSTRYPQPTSPEFGSRTPAQVQQAAPGASPASPHRCSPAAARCAAAASS